MIDEPVCLIISLFNCISSNNVNVGSELHFFPLLQSPSEGHPPLRVTKRNPEISRDIYINCSSLTYTNEMQEKEHFTAFSNFLHTQIRM